MTIQFYPKEKDARIFDANGQMICDLTDVTTTEKIDSILQLLGIRRRERWQGTEWGFEARLRKR